MELMEQVARHFFGEPTDKSSNGTELRWGTRGSMKIDVNKSCWFDHEAMEGGGPFDLVRREAGITDKDEYHAWLKREGFWEDKPSRNIIATYDYHDEGGKVLSQAVKFDDPNNRFSQRRPAGNGKWIWDLKGVRRVPYRLPELLEGIGNEYQVFIPEGEKDVDNLRKLGYVATCNSGGAARPPAKGKAGIKPSEHCKFQDALVPHFSGADVVIIADNDEAGRWHAAGVAAKLKGVAKRVRVLDLGAEWPECPAKGDISDWIAAGGTVEQLNEIVARLPDYSETEQTKHRGNGHDTANSHDTADSHDPGGPPRKDDLDAEVAELNRQYAFIIVGGKSAIMKFEQNKDTGEQFQLLQVGAFKQLFANKLVTVGKKVVPLADYWFAHEERRQYDGMEFVPPGSKPRPGYFNLWSGFSVEPRDGGCDLFLAHLKDNICQGDKDIYKWVVGWFAQMVQQPSKKPETSLFLRGPTRVGKTFVGQIIGSLFRAHYRLVDSPRLITGRFNSHMKSLLLLQADEAFWAGDKEALGRLKHAITGLELPIEYKGYEVVWIANYMRLFGTSNENWVVPAMFEEARFAVLDVGKAHQGDNAYFAAIMDEMDNGGREALLWHLLHFDLKQVNLYKIPRTGALIEQIIHNMPPKESWWLETLREGRLPCGCDELNECPKQALYDSYVRHSKTTSNAPRSIQTIVGMFLTKAVGAGLIDGRNRKIEHVNNHGGGSVEFGSTWIFPKLRVCRARYAEMIGQKIDWPKRWEDPLIEDEWAKGNGPEGGG